MPKLSSSLIIPYSSPPVFKESEQIEFQTKCKFRFLSILIDDKWRRLNALTIESGCPWVWARGCSLVPHYQEVAIPKEFNQTDVSCSLLSKQIKDSRSWLKVLQGYRRWNCLRCSSGRSPASLSVCLLSIGTNPPISH